MAGQIVKRADRTWLVRIYLGRDPQTGKRRYSAKTIHGTKKDAERYLAAALRDRDLGKYSGHSTVTMGELFDDLLRDYRINGKDAKWATRVVDKHLRPPFGAMRASALTSETIRRYVDQRQADGAANGTINRALALLRRALNLGKRASPPKVIDPPAIQTLRESEPRAGFFEYDEFSALRRELPEELRPLVTFAYFTGCRKGEIMGLTWAQVDLAARVVRLEPGTTKNREARNIPLSGELLEMLRFERHRRDEIVPDCPWVFHRLGEQIRNFRKSWDTAAQRAGLWDAERNRPSRTFHDFRRTGVRNLVRAGVSERVAMLISGHKTRSVFDRYNIVSERDLHDAARRLDEYMAHQGNRHTIGTHEARNDEAPGDAGASKLLN